ncbi:MAG: DMT family transporter [Lachnospiraceae bacterium]|nr:DMT family transporter [Lachnospiraceae bacterium]
MNKHESNIVIFSVMLCWAAAYVFVKSLPDELSDFGYIALVNGIAGIIMIAVFFPRLRLINKRNLLHGTILALIMMLVLIFEREGIDMLNPSAASVITSLDIVIVPLFMLFLGKLPSKNQVVAIALILTGILLTNGFSFSDYYLRGTLFMLGDCICMSLYTVVANRFCQNDDPIILVVSQIVIMAVISFVIWTVQEPGMIFRLDYTKEFLASLFVLAIFTKAYAYVLLMYGEAYADPVDVVIIFALEPVVTLLLAVFIPEGFGGVEESFSVMTLIGAVIIGIGAVIGQTDIKKLLERMRRLKGYARAADS